MSVAEEIEKREILNAYKGLLRSVKTRSKEDTKLIRKAFDVSLDAHKDMRRKSGEPYIFHPIAVARICAEEIGLGATSVICALLHDTVEDTYLKLEDIEAMFGKKVATIINGLTKISGVIDHTESIQAENFRKILLTLSEDIRVILIKLADRLHNMRTLVSMKREKQLKIASETLFLYAPLAHRLGLYNIKTELEDLSLKFQDPETYEEISTKLKKTQAVRSRFIRTFSSPIKRALDELGFNYEIKGRPKSTFSIYNKIKTKHVPFEEIYDLFAIRIVLDVEPQKEKAECWRAYSVVTDFYQPNPDRLRDWISMPKSNGYESLHTTVMSPSGKWVEVQIRSKRMDEIAEKGLAAHWKYKESNNYENNLENWITKIREVLENPDPNALEFIDDFKLNLFAEEIVVFTPKGEIKSLPAGATSLDFAFEIHTKVGAQCIGAKVNGKLVPLSHELKSGDQVEIITSNKQKPKEEWLKYVVTGKAKSKIKSVLKDEKRIIAADGKEKLEKKLESMGAENNHQNLREIMNYYKYNSEIDLLHDIALDLVNLDKLNKFTVEKGKLRHPQTVLHSKTDFEKLLKEKGKTEEMLVIGEDMDQFDYKLSPCCNPIPGDEVFGFITIHDGIKIHKTSCPNAVELMSNYAYRIVKARWTGQQKIAFLAGIKITGLDGVGIVNKITQIISSELNVNMRSISFDSNDGVFEGNIMVYVHDTNHLTSLLQKLKSVNGVISVIRIDHHS
jgi:guanosine-3',5'-bis(diphosphate) 3'-pyrophosphohydrolase